MNNNTRKRTGKEVDCFVCGKKTYKARYELNNVKDKKYTCSRKCANKKKSIIYLETIEKRLGIECFKDWLEQKYHEEKMNARDISEIVYGKKTHGPNIIGWMKRLGIKRRNRSESIALQWVDNAERKKKQAVQAVKYMGQGTAGRNRLLALMNSIEYKKKSSESKMGEKNPMYGVVGKKHPQWNPNRTKEQRIEERKTDLDRNWRIGVIVRDGRECAVCSYDGRDIVVHHLNSYHWDVKNRYNIDNGIVLCEKCHKDFHSKYGYKYNTKEQFYEYMKEHSKITNKQLRII